MVLTLADCVKLAHAIEFVEEAHGVIIWRCVSCGVNHTQFEDCCAGR